MTKVEVFLVPRNEQVIRGGSFPIFTKKFIGKSVKTQLVCFIVTLLRNFIGLDDVYASEITTYLKKYSMLLFWPKNDVMMTKYMRSRWRFGGFMMPKNVSIYDHLIWVF